MTTDAHAQSLSSMVSAASPFGAVPEGEGMWIDVITKMDEVYSDLLRYEADLEAKNSELEAAQAFISSVVASVSDSLVVVDGSGHVVRVNPAFERLTGLCERDVAGRPLGDHLASADATDFLALLKAGGGPTEREWRLVTASGAAELMAIACSPRVDSSGHLVGLVLTGRPIGELRRAYEALNLAHKDLQTMQQRLVEQEKLASLGRLVAGVAHELNNPISFVYGNIHTLDRYRKRLSGFFDEARTGGDPGEMMAKYHIEAILADLKPLIEGTLEGAERISDIVRNLRRLSFSRPGEVREVDLDRLCRTTALWAEQARGSAVKVRVKIAGEARVEGQEGQLHQVLVNLIENALDAVRGQPAPLVEVEVRSAEGFVDIHVRDNGPGVAEQNRDKLFEPFFTTKPVGEGTGLGLWISYSIAREHGGEIQLRRPAEGAEFVLRLPAPKP